MNKGFLLKIIVLAAAAFIIPAAVFAFVERATVLTYPASNVGATSAFFKGDVTSDGGCAELKLWFQFGATENYGMTTPMKESNQIGPFGITMNGLSPCATYHYRAVVENNTRRANFGQDVTFVTAGCPSLPVIIGKAATTVDTSLATAVSTGATAGLWNSLLLPAFGALLIVWLFRSRILGLDKWIGERKRTVGEYRARKELERRISRTRKS